MLAARKRQTMYAAFWVWAVMLLLTSPANAVPQQKFPIGSPMSKAVAFQYAVYFLPTPSTDPMAALRAALRTKSDSPKLVSGAPRTLAKPVMTVHLVKDVANQYPPPDLRSLQYFGRGLSSQQATALQKSEQAMVMNFGHSSTHVWSALKAATQIAETLARATNGLIWDEETREIFTPDEWHKRRIAAWTGTIPRVADHTTIHAYNDGEYVRAISLGMEKFGLPDVVIENFSWSLNRNMGHLINAFGQLMAEGRQIASAGEYELNFRAIKDRAVRDDYVKSLKPNGTAVAHLTLMQGLPEEGDPQNRLIEIAFEKYPGVDVHAQQDAMISSLFGWEETIKRIRHNEALNAASKRAKARLPALRKAFANGLAPGEYIQVKAPFDTPDNSKEWMWVEITEWNGARIKGLLKNEPVATPGLHGGQIVQVREKDVFDYIRHYPNGKEEGNETSTIILKMQGSVERQE